MRTALVGFGGVGRAFLKLVNDKKDYFLSQGMELSINYVINSSGGVYNPFGIDCDELSKFTSEGGKLWEYPVGGSKGMRFGSVIQNRDADLVVELTPTNKETGEPGMGHIVKSLENGMHVVTGNKGPIVLAYKELARLAASRGVQLGIGCTTGGALPAINSGRIDLAGSDILLIEGVLNGTTNFILAQMESEGISYTEALRKAQEHGIAEADPTLDVEGWDTASKLLILTNVLMNEDKRLSDIDVEGISKITPVEICEALSEGKKYRLIGKTVKKDRSLEMTVKLEKIDSTHPLYGVDGKNKGVRYVTDTHGDLTVIGGASGATSAAAAILRDIINICRGCKY